MKADRFERNVLLVGREGQAKLRAASVAVVGIGGLGTHVVQQLALLVVGVRHDHPIPGSREVNIAERLVHSIDPAIRVVKVFDSLVSEKAFEVVKGSDYVIGCLDSEGARLVLSELCATYSRPYLDLASDVVPGEKPEYGGRVCVSMGGEGCLVCLGVLDVAEAQRELAGPEAHRDREAIYGVERGALGRSGPSVVSINGVVASLAVSELMVTVAGLRPPKRLLFYYGHGATVRLRTDNPLPDCYYCKGVRGLREKADVERYIRQGVGRWLR